MKNPRSDPFFQGFSAVVCCLSGMTVHAAIIEKADNATGYNLNGSWSGGVVPRPGDTASWSSTMDTASHGANTNYSGIRITDPGGAVTINGADGLTLGAAGIELVLRSGVSAISCGELPKNHIERQPLKFSNHDQLS